MNKYEEKARALFLEGYNCAQAVTAAFAEEIGMDEQTALALSSPFGGGMGRMREVCGAVSGMWIVLGTKEGYTDPSDHQAKKDLYATVQMLAARFREENGSIICRDLLGGNPSSTPNPSARTAAYYEKRPCVDLVGSAARIIAEYLHLS